MSYPIPAECYRCPSCPFYCIDYPFPLPSYVPSDPPPPPPPPPPKHPAHHLSPLSIIAIIMSTFFLFLCFFRFMSNSSCSDRNPSPAGPTPHANNDHASGAGNDAGLEQHVINSIAMFKYAPGDGLVQATDCSVCLNEFRDEEILRLLPNCTHAFHRQCIDLWLKSHVNCPLCRAGIASNDQMGSSLMDTDRGSSDVAGRIQMENSESRTRVGDDRGSGVGTDHQSFVPVDVGGLDGEDGGMDIEALRNMFYPGVNCGFHMHTDLVDDRRPADCTIMIMDDKIQPSRRSGSMESSSASFPLDNSEGSCTATSSILRGDRKSGHRRNQNPFKLMGSCSNGPSLHTRPVLMKRSFSRGSRFFSSRHRRTKDSLLLLPM